VLTAIEAGTASTNDSAIGAGRIVKVAWLVCDGLLVTVAVTVTVVPIGVADGAVNSVVPPSAV